MKVHVRRSPKTNRTSALENTVTSKATYGVCRWCPAVAVDPSVVLTVSVRESATSASSAFAVLHVNTNVRLTTTACPLPVQNVGRVVAQDTSLPDVVTIVW
eukprot:TRINITY_DN42499_c0_g1_i2.p2 TRINITY_DN42499_c0_g1~~TRINITY_DN42499_c0_g1_i2.p2  ORF type:complete len:101 (+),score=3.90 TRINITY_DN42499_c0_g1_i2:352-654(+)